MTEGLIHAQMISNSSLILMQSKRTLHPTGGSFHGMLAFTGCFNWMALTQSTLGHKPPTLPALYLPRNTLA